MLRDYLITRGEPTIAPHHGGKARIIGALSAISSDAAQYIINHVKHGKIFRCCLLEFNVEIKKFIECYFGLNVINVSQPSFDVAVSLNDCWCCIICGNKSNIHKTFLICCECVNVCTGNKFAIGLDC